MIKYNCMYVYGLIQLKVVFIIMYLQHLSYMFRPFFHRAIIRLICEMFTVQMWLRIIWYLVLRIKLWTYINQGVFSR
jgi:hypothetical protein